MRSGKILFIILQSFQSQIFIPEMIEFGCSILKRLWKKLFFVGPFLLFVSAMSQIGQEINKSARSGRSSS